MIIFYYYYSFDALLSPLNAYGRGDWTNKNNNWNLKCQKVHGSNNGKNNAMPIFQFIDFICGWRLAPHTYAFAIQMRFIPLDTIQALEWYLINKSNFVPWKMGSGLPGTSISHGIKRIEMSLT